MEQKAYIVGKNIQLPNYMGYLVETENRTETIVFCMPRNSVLDGLVYYLTYVNQNSQGDTVALTKNLTDKEIQLSWGITSAVTAAAGKVTCQIGGYSVGDVPGTDTPLWLTFKTIFNVAEALDPSAVFPEVPTVFAQYLSQMEAIKDDVEALMPAKADKVSGATAGDVAVLDSNGNLADSEIPAGDIVLKDVNADDGNVAVFLSGVPSDSNVPLTTLALKSETAHSMSVSIDTSTYVLTFSLKNSAGTEIDSDSIDLPLETMVVSGSYDSVNKKIILTLKSGSTIEFSVADLISGLVSTSTFETHTDDTDIHVTAQKQSDWDDKYDLPLTGIPKTDLASGVQTSLGLADSAYQKPSGGIPSSDMSSAVQTSLGKADTALQEHQDISGKADKATTLAGYGITDAKIESGTITLGSNTITPLTSHQDISGKADKVSGASNGNLAGLDSNGNLTDSGVPSTVIPTGGTAGQYLKKKSATDYDSEWSSELPDRLGALDWRETEPTNKKVSLDVETDEFWDTVFDNVPTEEEDGIFLCMAPSAPSSSLNSGLKGQFYMDTDYMYVCIADNTWRRFALSTF